LIGGYSAKSIHGEIWELSFPNNSLNRRNSPEQPYALLCGGQCDAIQRFIDGIEPSVMQQLMLSLRNTVGVLIGSTAKKIADHILSELKKKGFDVPPFDSLPPPSIEGKFQIPFKLARYKIPHHLMSLQDSVDFVTFLGYITFGRQRFVIGVPTVGGSFKIAVITRKEGFKLLTKETIELRSFQL
jgi:hypothetical protein